MKTITIAADEHTALSVSNYFAFREVGRKGVDLSTGRLTPEAARDYITTSAYMAYNVLLNNRFDRIIIVTDYMRWRLDQPGQLTNLWRLVGIQQALWNIRVVFK